MLEYPWNEKNNTSTWLSSLYSLFKPKIWLSYFLEMKNNSQLVIS